jgi:hypothetical protein
MIHNIIVTAICLAVVPLAQVGAQTSDYGPNLKAHDVGNVLRVVRKNSYVGFSHQGPFCEYPRGSGMDHVYPTSDKFELGALAPPGDTLQYRYSHNFGTFSFEQWDSIWVVTDNNIVDMPYWHSYEGISDQDFVCRYHNNYVTYGGSYCDTNIFFGYQPLNVDVVEQSFAWINPPLGDVIVYAYHITPTVFDLKNAYIVLHFFGGIGTLGGSDPWVNLRGRYLDDQSNYYSDEHLGIVTDGPFGLEGQAKSCIGYKLFPPRGLPAGGWRWSFSDDGGQHDPAAGNLEAREPPPCIRSERDRTNYLYNLVTSGVSPVTSQNRGSGYISFGPLDLRKGDTASFWTAEILGMGTDDVLRKAAILDSIYSRDFRTPKPPPPPHVRVDRGNKQVTLRWDALPGEVNPETYVDTYRGDKLSTPFEGYRVYKSTQSLDGPWIPLAEYDIAGDGFGHEFGLQHSFTDVGLLNNFEYYYAVTAFSKMDTVYGFRSRESRISLSAVRASPGLAPAKQLGEVAVVPNPYRGDIDYNKYTPAWERPSEGRLYWLEQDRRVQFINLPERCEIRIYTLGGDLVQTLNHDDPINSYHDWNLTSHVGQATASGIYLFTVEDKIHGGVQVGKFVIIK